MFSITHRFVLYRLFLAALLDALGTSVQRSLATGLGRHLLARLLVCKQSVSRCRFALAAVRRMSGESYRPSSSRGKPSHLRRDPCSASSGPSRAWPCRLEISTVSLDIHGGAVQFRGGRRWQDEGKSPSRLEPPMMNLLYREKCSVRCSGERKSSARQRESLLGQSRWWLAEKASKADSLFRVGLHVA